MVSEIKQLSPVLFFLGAWESLQEWQQGKSHSPMEWKSVAVSRGVPPQKSEFVGLFSKLWGCSHPSAPGSLSKAAPHGSGAGICHTGTRTAWGQSQLSPNMEITWSHLCPSHGSFWHRISSSFAMSMSQGEDLEHVSFTI